MPVIELKTTEQIGQEGKKRIADGFSKAFDEAGEHEVSGNILTRIEGEQWIDFRHNETEPSALVVLHPGPLTPKKDYARIVAGIFRTLKEELPRIRENRIYVTVAQIDYWGWDGRLL